MAGGLYRSNNHYDPIEEEIKRNARRIKKEKEAKEEQQQLIEDNFAKEKDKDRLLSEEEVIDQVINGKKIKKDKDGSLAEKLGKKELNEQEAKNAKTQFNPRLIARLYPNEVEKIGKLFDYEYELNDDGSIKTRENQDGSISKVYKRNSDGSKVITNVVDWDDEVKYDLRRGKETYDSYITSVGQRESIDEQTIIRDKALKELAGIILHDAIDAQVSDMEIVQYQHFGVVRFTDGPDSWYVKRLLYKSSVDPLITIIKDMAGMKIKLSNEREPQTNGSIVLGNTNFRVATGASQYGMFIDLRRQGKLFESLDDLDFPDLVKHEFRRDLRAKDGLIIVGGPVGSGKTTLMTTGLIERLKETNGSIKIMSLEKPIETPTPGIIQEDIDDSYGLTWSNAIQASLRMAPTILRVGEVNEEPAARAIVRAANSGIVALTTMHIKSALEVFETLKDYNISENDIKNSLRLVVYLNRVPKLCPHCMKKSSVALHANDNNWIKNRLNDSRSGAVGEIAYRNPDGCEICRRGQNDKSLYGTLGKVGIYELLRVNKPLLRIWRKYSQYDNYVLRDMLLHPERIHFDDPDANNENKELTKNNEPYNDEDSPVSGLMFYPLQRDILDKLKNFEIDIDTAKYLLNE